MDPATGTYSFLFHEGINHLKDHTTMWTLIMLINGQATERDVAVKGGWPSGVAQYSPEQSTFYRRKNVGGGTTSNLLP
ncbi:hypothetical protein OPV22_004871 [Ensete ventricosum]|uniref:Neprosin domain-containing protein n=1 Tax=Ensete ventricosum TaxID=4639 RepID=A0AAV8RQA7_ENSVE|nr:hypothetical protein OPV22_004871 [Ensete ventricosum]